jgi:hypothetical protein
VANYLEAKVVVKVRSVLLANATVAGMVGTRVFDSHVSTVSDPVYPCVSLHALDGSAIGVGPNLVRFSLQVDLWFPADEQAKSRLYDCADAVRRALHWYGVNDGTVAILGMVEQPGGAVLYESERALWHLAKRFDVFAA